MIKFNGEVYSSIDKFDCHTISLNTAGGGGYGTVIPISDLEYRKENPTKAGVVIHIGIKQTDFYITSDLGDEYLVSIDNCHNSEIMSAIISANDLGLIMNTEKPDDN